MKILRGISYIFWLPLLIQLYSCNAQPKKEDFIAKYYIDKTIPVDTTSKTLLKNQRGCKLDNLVGGKR